MADLEFTCGVCDEPFSVADGGRVRTRYSKLSPQGAPICPGCSASTYVCCVCGNEFRKTRTDAEALAEAGLLFAPPNDVATVCDDCFGQRPQKRSPTPDDQFHAFLRLKYEAEERGGEAWIGFRAGLIFRGCWHFSRGEQIPGWWGWFR